jgi:hypothetical protein
MTMISQRKHQKGKTGKTVVASYTLLCPHCAEAISEPETYSHQWMPEQTTILYLTCMECDGLVKVPKVLIRT